MAMAHVYYNLIAAYAPSPYKEQGIDARDKLAAKMDVKLIAQAQQAAQGWRKKTRKESYPPENFETGDTLGAPGAKQNEKDQPKKEQKKKITVATELEDLLMAAGFSRRELFNAVQKNDFSAVVEKMTEKAENDDVLALVVLGDLYALGQGMEADPAKARDFYTRAAAKGGEYGAIGAFRLAPFYCQANGVEQSFAECYKWFLVADKYANADSKKLVGQALQLVKDNVSEQDIAAGQKSADEYLAVPQENAGFFNSLKKSLFAPKDAAQTAQPKKAEKTEAAEKPAEEDDILPDL